MYMYIIFIYIYTYFRYTRQVDYPHGGFTNGKSKKASSQPIRETEKRQYQCGEEQEQGQHKGHPKPPGAPHFVRARL